MGKGRPRGILSRGDRGGFGLVHRHEQDLDQPGSIGYMAASNLTGQRTEIIAMQSCVRLYMGRQRERLDLALSGRLNLDVLLGSETDYNSAANVPQPAPIVAPEPERNGEPKGERRKRRAGRAGRRREKNEGKKDGVDEDEAAATAAAADQVGGGESVKEARLPQQDDAGTTNGAVESGPVEAVQIQAPAEIQPTFTANVFKISVDPGLYEHHEDLLDLGSHPLAEQKEQLVEPSVSSQRPSPAERVDGQKEEAVNEARDDIAKGNAKGAQDGTDTLTDQLTSLEATTNEKEDGRAEIAIGTDKATSGEPTATGDDTIERKIDDVAQDLDKAKISDDDDDSNDPDEPFMNIECGVPEPQFVPDHLDLELAPLAFGESKAGNTAEQAIETSGLCKDNSLQPQTCFNSQQEEQAPKNDLLVEENREGEDSQDEEFDMSWLALPEIPSSQELTTNEEDCQPWFNGNQEDFVPAVVNKIHGPWKSKSEYLGTQYKLLREDAIKPLRDAISYIRSSPYARESDMSHGSIGIYDRVHVSGITYSTHGIAIKVVFSLNRVEKQILWEQSKRLTTGSLVALTPIEDPFSTECYVAVVAGRRLEGLKKNPPEIDLFFAVDNEIQLDSSIEFLMIEERDGFFEAERHTLVALQNMMTEPFPLKEHLVDLEESVLPPSYVEEDPMLNLSPVYETAGGPEKFNVFDAWPQDLDTSLDKTQISALRRMLTKQLAIVQGPPGTGKTHVSVKAIEVMLKSIPEDAPPIILTCQTNHALDQLLRHIAKFEPKYARLGSRSKDEEIAQNHTLFPLRQLMEMPRFVNSSLATAGRMLEGCIEKMLAILEPLTEESRSAIDPQKLVRYGILTNEQISSLERCNADWLQANRTEDEQNENPIASWLGSAYSESEKTFQEDNFGYEFEDADPEFEEVKEKDAEDFTGEDGDDFEKVHGVFTSIHSRFSARRKVSLEDDACERILAKNSNLYRIDSKFRGAVFNYIMKRLKQIIIQEFRIKAREYRRLASHRRTGMFERDVAVLKQQRIVGLTTTGLSKYRAMIVALRPRVVMIEEAAESLEAPVIAACIPSLQQLVLVGDHKQLRPHTHVQKHAGDPVNLNVSLFERMITNDIEFTVLRRQRRMRPEVRRILRPIYRDALRDHDTVKDDSVRPPILGMGGLHSYFLTHEFSEQRDTHMSCYNDWEANMVTGLVEYLGLNGTPGKNITVITFYNGQRKRIRSLLKQNPNTPEHVEVATVDSYQGEENEVIILSLVRSNQKNRIGFLEVENRVCVALSRARNGLYIIGNGMLVCGENEIWESVVSIMAGKAGEDPPAPVRRLGFHLPLTCTNHGRKTFIGDISDWGRLHGGCEIKCKETLACGHQCPLKCHPFEHTQVTCGVNCEAILPCEHRCAEKCGMLCVCVECGGANLSGLEDDVDEQVEQANRKERARQDLDIMGEEPEAAEHEVNWTPDGDHNVWPPPPVAAFRPDVWDGQFDGRGGPDSDLILDQ